MTDGLEATVRKLSLGPSDIVVVTLQERATRWQIEGLQDLFKRAGVKNKILVLEDGADLKVLNPEALGEPT